jgi:hypothetical protein
VDVLDHRPLLHGRLRVLLAEIPVQRQLVPEPRNELADVKTAPRAGVTAVELSAEY